MGKVMYSLMLDDEVVSIIDKLALKKGTTRSNLVNQILAEHASYLTPEKKIDSIFRQMEEILRMDEGIVPTSTPSQSIMSIRSSLEYKYRPTVKYDLRLYRVQDDGCIGELSVSVRTRSAELLQKTEEFFLLWAKFENAYLAPIYNKEKIGHEISPSRMIRKIPIIPGKEYTPKSLGEAISSYIRIFDSAIKAYAVQRLSREEIERLFRDRSLVI